MADNVAITAGSGTTIAADDIGGVKHQRVKLSLGADGTAVDAGAGAGAVGTDTQRVTLASDDPAVTGLGSLTETAPANDTASSGLNGRLQRIAQRLTSLIALFTAGASAIAKAEDAASADADVGVPAMAVRKATPANTSGTDGDYEMLQVSGGRLWASATIDAALPAGSNAIGGVGLVPSATATAPTVLRVTAAASTNATSVKASAGNLYAVRLFNVAASTRYVKFYNKASAPTVGTDTPVFIVPLPAGGGYSELFEMPIAFSTGIAYAITGAITDADTTAVTANDVVGHIQYL